MALFLLNTTVTLLWQQQILMELYDYFMHHGNMWRTLTAYSACKTHHCPCELPECHWLGYSITTRHRAASENLQLNSQFNSVQTHLIYSSVKWEGTVSSNQWWNWWIVSLGEKTPFIQEAISTSPTYVEHVLKNACIKLHQVIKSIRQGLTWAVQVVVFGTW